MLAQGPGDPLGAYGTTVTVLSSSPSPLAPELAPELVPELAKELLSLVSSTPARTTPAQPDVEQISTPPTPPMRD